MYDINETRLVEHFLQLVHIDSPPTKEGQVMALLAEELQSLGLTVTFDQAYQAVDGEVGNLIATLPAKHAPNAPSIFLSAHVDTVAPTAGIQTVVEDGVIRTDGTTILGADDKAAVAALFEALRFVVTHDLPHGEVQLLLSICEEVGLKGAVAMDANLIRGSMGFVFDSGQPVAGVIVNSPSHDRLRFVVRGRKAHAGAAPEDGVSAIQVAAIAIARMNLGRIDAETTANVGIIHGGEATNVIPDFVEIQAEARSRSEAKLAAQIDHMEQALQQAAVEMGATVEIDHSRHYSSFRLGANDVVVRTACAALRRLGMEPELKPSGGGSDANIFNERGIPSVVLGVGYENIHTCDERIAIADLVSSSQLAVSIIETVAAGGAA